MAKLPKLDENIFLSDPFTALQNCIDDIIKEREPFIINAVYIKTECETHVLNIAGEKYRINKRDSFFSIGLTGQVVQVDSRKIYICPYS